MAAEEGQRSHKDDKRWAREAKTQHAGRESWKKGAKMAPSRLQDGHKMAQAGPEMSLFSTQSPRCAEFWVSSLKRRLERASDRVKMTKGGSQKPKLSTPGGRAGNGDPKKAPRWPQDGSKMAQDDPKTTSISS